MPDSLTTLLGLSSNRTPAPYTPNIKRNNALVSSYRNFFGIQGPDTGDTSEQEYQDAFDYIRDEQAAQDAQKAQAAAYNERVKGEYGLAQERIKAETARANAEEVYNRAEAQRQFTAQQNQMTRDALSQRQQYGQSQINQRSQGIESGRNYRQQRALANQRAGQYESDKLNAPVDRSLSNFFGLMPGTQHNANIAEASRIRQEALNLPEDAQDDITSTAQSYRQAYPNLSPEQLMSIIQATEVDATPDELEALYAAIQE